MNNLSHNTHNELKHEQGTMKSYVIGFILSLIFTFIPYYLVKYQILSGSSLLIMILGFAVLQLIVQVIFFLHLGRGPKPNWNLFFFIATVGIILVVVGGSIMIMSNLYRNMTPLDQVSKLTNDEGIYQIGGEKTGACQGQHANHKITIKNSQASPLNTDARLCETLTFINEDNEEREITFGTHPEHGVYAGETELVVRKGRAKTITLSEAGTYNFHDHLHAEIEGSFTVRTQ